jgi:hypothetical protein
LSEPARYSRIALRIVANHNLAGFKALPGKPSLRLQPGTDRRSVARAGTADELAVVRERDGSAIGSGEGTNFLYNLRQNN